VHSSRNLCNVSANGATTEHRSGWTICSFDFNRQYYSGPHLVKNLISDNGGGVKSQPHFSVPVLELSSGRRPNFNIAGCRWLGIDSHKAGAGTTPAGTAALPILDWSCRNVVIEIYLKDRSHRRSLSEYSSFSAD